MRCLKSDCQHWLKDRTCGHGEARGNSRCPIKPYPCPYCGVVKAGRAMRCHIQACAKRDEALLQNPTEHRTGGQQ